VSAKNQGPSATPQTAHKPPAQNKLAEPYGPPAPKGKSESGHTIDTFIPQLFSDEGGYTPGKIDRKGPTKIGINKDTLQEYVAWKKSKNEPLPADFTTDIKKVTPRLARQIYEENYYKRYNFDKISNPKITAHLLDIAINSGPFQSGKWIQEELNEKMGAGLKVDGTIGSQTRKAIEEADKKGMLNEINDSIVEKRIQFYKKIAKEDPIQKDHLDGWLDRAERFRTKSKK
jgi:lysozyme family protein